MWVCEMAPYKMLLGKRTSWDLIPVKIIQRLKKVHS